MKYSKNFERDYTWYVNNSSIFTFDGHLSREVKYDEKGYSAKYCFYKFDSEGILPDTFEPEHLKLLFKCKGSINFMIKEWAQDRAKGYLPKIEFEKIAEEYNLLPWMVEAVENQKYKYYEK
jgi:hypothetical protein